MMGSVMRRPRADEWVDGLGIAEGICVLPHHERSNPDQVAEQVQERLSNHLTILGIDAQTACLGNGYEWRVTGHGKVTVYRPQGWEQFQPGEIFKTG